MSQERPRGPELPGPIVTADEASLRYQGEWVLMRVTGLDERQRIFKGEILHHSKSRREISRHIKQLHRRDPTAHVLVTLGGTRKLEPDDFRQVTPASPPSKIVNARQCSF
jgi:hypothetical protein